MYVYNKVLEKNIILKMLGGVEERENDKYRVWYNYCDCLFNFFLCFFRGKKINILNIFSYLFDESKLVLREKKS